MTSKNPRGSGRRLTSVFWHAISQRGSRWPHVLTGLKASDFQEKGRCRLHWYPLEEISFHRLNLLYLTNKLSLSGSREAQHRAKQRLILSPREHFKHNLSHRYVRVFQHCFPARAFRSFLWTASTRICEVNSSSWHRKAIMISTVQVEFTDDTTWRKYLREWSVTRLGYHVRGPRWAQGRTPGEASTIRL